MYIDETTCMCCLFVLLVGIPFSCYGVVIGPGLPDETVDCYGNC